MSSELRRRVRDRDRNLSRVRRLTGAVAAVSLGACAAVAGLAVGSTRVPLHTATTATTTTTTQAATTTASTSSTSTSTTSAALSAASSAPVSSSSTPVATSGGS